LINMSGPNHLRLLYHYTSVANLQAILDSGELIVSGGPVGRRFAASPLRVVWLTDDADPGHGDDHGLGAGASGDPTLDKRVVRFTVSVSVAQHWPEWAHRRHIHRKTLRELDGAGGGLSERWWVVPSAIPARDWVRVENLRTGESIWPVSGVRPRERLLA
jgi:hypothetical protein